MEGEGDLLKAVSLSLQTSHTLRELPRKTPPVHGKDFLCFAGRRGLAGKFLLVWGGVDLLQSAASHPVGVRDAELFFFAWIEKFFETKANTEYVRYWLVCFWGEKRYTTSNDVTDKVTIIGRVFHEREHGQPKDRRKDTEVAP